MDEDGQMNDLSQEQTQHHDGASDKQSSDIATSEAPTVPPMDSSSATFQNGTEDKAVEELDPKDPLDPFDWDALEDKYHAKMRECQRTEEGIYADFAAWIKVFETWASVTTSYENERSHKRLKTRTSFVQSAEERLEEKRKHYMKVVKAFESALALLGEGA